MEWSCYEISSDIMSFDGYSQLAAKGNLNAALWVRVLLAPHLRRNSAMTYTWVVSTFQHFHISCRTLVSRLVCFSSISSVAIMSLRLGLRQLQFARLGRGQIRANVPRRYQVTDATAGAPAQTLVQRLWHSPVGVKTVHFW